MKRLAIIPTVFALVVMVAACTENTTAPDVTPQFSRASQPNCIEVLVAFFAPGEGLRTNLQDVMFIAEFFGIPTGTVISRLTGRIGTFPECIDFINTGG